MKKTIWKYDVPVTQEFTLAMPKGAELLSVQEQREQVRLWALVDPSAMKVTRKFQVVGTGWDFDPTDLTFVGTYQVSGGDFVFHLFEIDR